MSGHSHFKTVAATKNANDAKKGKIFSKMARVITIAVKDRGPDVASNIQLKAAIEKAKEFNMPKENIERAIKKGTGELAGEVLEEVSFEAFGPGGIAMIIEGITDNKNRALGEIKGVLSQYEGKMAGEGAVKWMFEKRGSMIVNSEGKSKEELELLIIEVGAEYMSWQNSAIEVYTKPKDLEKIKKILGEKGLKIEDSSLGWFAKEEVAISDRDKEKAQKIFQALNESDAVQDIYSNLKG